MPDASAVITVRRWAVPVRVECPAMGYVRLYRMTARDGMGPALRAALEALASRVAALSGSAGTELFEDAEKPGQFVFLERWTSADAHQDGGKLLGKEAFAPIMAVLSGPPESAALTPLD